MPTVDYLPVAAAGGANVESQADFAGSGHQVDGFTSGIALAEQLNKCWRQSSMVSAAIANFISQQLGIDVLDDGNLTALIAELTEAVEAAAAIASAPKVVTVTFSTTPVFDCSAGSLAVPVFHLTLTGNVSSSTLTNAVPGQIVIFIIEEDGVGSRSFVPPTTVPMGTIVAAASTKNIQAFIVLSGSMILPLSGLVVA